MKNEKRITMSETASAVVSAYESSTGSMSDKSVWRSVMERLDVIEEQICVSKLSTVLADINRDGDVMMVVRLREVSVDGSQELADAMASMSEISFSWVSDEEVEMNLVIPVPWISLSE